MAFVLTTQEPPCGFESFNGSSSYAHGAWPGHYNVPRVQTAGATVESSHDVTPTVATRPLVYR